MDKKKLYLILIIVCAVILTGLIIWAICIKLNKTPDAGETIEATQSTEAIVDTGTEETADNATSQPEETTAAAEETEPVETTEATEGETNGDEEDPDNNPTTPTKPNTPTTPTEPDLPDVYPYTLTYKEYLAMTEEEQIAFYNCFESHDKFKAWRTVAKKEYEDSQIKIEIGPDGTIDLDKILNGDN